jgi:aspartyl/glutamyl-tRNA(Asn/Gln) amidotransferase C subunit
MDYNVKTIANLAHINLSDERDAMLQQDFGNILEYVNTLSDLHLESQTIPQYHTQTLREDIGFIDNPRFNDNVKQNIIAEMPLTEYGYLVVKSVLKK